MSAGPSDISAPVQQGPVPGPASGLAPGLAAGVTLTVTGADTAAALGSGDVPVLGTPRLIALCEEASCRAMDGRLAGHCTSVASRIELEHLAPAAVGSTVTAEVTLQRVEGRRLIFTVSVRLGSDAHAVLIGAGRLTRVVVDRAKLLAKTTGAG